jgi:hypothetical protein
MASDLQKILLSTVLRQNPNNTTSPTNAFNLSSTAVQAYLTQKLKGILPNATGAITENELMTAWLLANSGGGSGSVTSVDLSMPSAFAVTGNPITTSGTLTVTGAGTTSEYVRGDGSLATLPVQIVYTRLNDNDTVNFYDYCGTAPLGTSTSGTWLIRRINWITTTPITQSASGSWVNRASLIYT